MLQPEGLREHRHRTQAREDSEELLPSTDRPVVPQHHLQGVLRGPVARHNFMPIRSLAALYRQLVRDGAPVENMVRPGALCLGARGRSVTDPHLDDGVVVRWWGGGPAHAHVAFVERDRGVRALLPERADAPNCSNAIVFGVLMAALMEWRRRKSLKR